MAELIVAKAVTSGTATVAENHPSSIKKLFRRASRRNCRSRYIPSAASQYRQFLSLVLILQIVLWLTACESISGLKKTQQATSNESSQNQTYGNEHSSTPLTRLPKDKIFEAQQRLSLLGYGVGPVDGIWGPRSAKAIRNFELDNGLSTANGFLSELNLHMLDTLTHSKRQRSRRASKAESGQGISAKLDKSVGLNQGPQLVFTDREYDLLLKPNPYSERLVRLTKGVGIYVLSLQEGWFEVESENQQKGYIKAD